MSDPCTRFEREGLKAYLRGMIPDRHFDSCADCRALRARYSRLERDLASLRCDDAPPAGYQARVWERIAERQATAKPWYQRWWWLALPAPVIAAVALIIALPDERANPTTPALSYEVARPSDATRRRGLREAQPGDVLSLQATTDDARVIELRVYRGDDDLILRCSDEPPCERLDGVVRANTVLPTRGEYQVLLLASDAPVPAPASSLARDIAVAEETGATVERSEPILVR